MQASALLLHWESYLWASNLWVLIIYFSSQLCCPLRFQSSLQTCQWECFLVFGNFSLFKTPFLERSSVPTSFVSFFVFYIFPTTFRRQWAAFLGTWIFCWHSEVVLWNLLSVQVFFGWICGRESGLLVLFLCHLRTTFLKSVLKWSKRIHVSQCSLQHHL